MARNEPDEIYQFRAVLRAISPLIWRRLLVRSLERLRSVRSLKDLDALATTLAEAYQLVVDPTLPDERLRVAVEANYQSSGDGSFE
jgi:hypothetical protein